LPLAIHCSVPEKFWLALLKAVDRVDLADDPRFKTRDSRRDHYEALEQELAPVFTSRTRADWLMRLEAEDVPVAPIYNVAEVLADPQVRHLGLTEEIAHPKAGKLGFVGAPITYDGLPKTSSMPPPELGEQTLAILTEMGYGRAAIQELVQKGITKLAQN
jgi:crotonobetainyl-CoA:carnitine CoA-transferase CaiB-like acyl-CoA transferase